MATIGNFLVALLLFGLMVFVHELGHYLAARATGIGVKEFSIGFGPALAGFRRGDTRYVFRLIPMGGYCRFYGEEEGEGDRPDAYDRQKVWKRMITTVSGPLMNGVLAYLAIVVFLLAVGYAYNVPRVEQVSPGSAAETAGVLPGDVVYAVDGGEISYDTAGVQQLIQRLQEDPESPKTLDLRRGGQQLSLTIQPEKTEAGYQIGVLLGAEQYRYPLGEALSGGLVGIRNMLVLMVDAIVKMFATGEGLEETGGPVMILSVMTQSVSQGMDMVLNLVVIISLNLGLINLLPLPALDGGHLVLQLIEWIRGKPISRKYALAIQIVGFSLLMALFLVLTFRDVGRLITG